MTFTYARDEAGLYICPHCSAKKRLPSTMNMHRRICEGDLPHECSKCKYKCLSKQRLDLHMASKHRHTKEARSVPLLKCPVVGCDFHTLANGNRLIHFMRKHCTNEVFTILTDKDNHISCKKCMKEFHSNTAFQYHAAHCIKLTDSIKNQYLQALIG
jgi:DNA-directed RNA polymerase subunit RPC12/RpoP